MKNCNTCKKDRGNRCKVLKEKIGLKAECWAWTDDPEWETKVKQAVKKYSER